LFCLNRICNLKGVQLVDGVGNLNRQGVGNLVANAIICIMSRTGLIIALGDVLLKVRTLVDDFNCIYFCIIFLNAQLFVSFIIVNFKFMCG